MANVKIGKSTGLVKKYGKSVKKYRASYSKLSSARMSVRKGPEVKGEMANVAPITLAPSATVLSLAHSINQGTSQVDRVGNKILVKNWQVRGSLKTGANITTTVSYRLIWFIDTSPSQITPTAGDLLVTNDILSLPNINTTQRFIILKDMSGSMPTPIPYWNINSSIVNTHPITVPFNFYIPKLDIPVSFAGNTGTSTDMMSNGFYCMVFADTAALVDLSFNSRLNFIDN